MTYLHKNYKRFREKEIYSFNILCEVTYCICQCLFVVSVFIKMLITIYRRAASDTIVLDIFERFLDEINMKACIVTQEDRH